jgi:hypothetical protein
VLLHLYLGIQQIIAHMLFPQAALAQMLNVKRRRQVNKLVDQVSSVLLQFRQVATVPQRLRVTTLVLLHCRLNHHCNGKNVETRNEYRKGTKKGLAKLASLSVLCEYF